MRKATATHMAYSELPETARLSIQAKHLIDTIKMIAYRASQSSDQAVHHICDVLNATETLFPGTDLRPFYESVAPQSP